MQFDTCLLKEKNRKNLEGKSFVEYLRGNTQQMCILTQLKVHCRQQHFIASVSNKSDMDVLDFQSQKRREPFATSKP